MPVARRTFLASTLATLAAPAIVRLARADAPPQFTFKLHHSFSSVSSAHDRFLLPWARQVEAQSGGRIRIDLFPSMQLGGQPAELFDQARDGVAEIVLAEPSLTPGRFPKIEVFELPFVPSRRALVSSKAVQDYANANLSDEFREIHPICFSCSDRGVLHTNQPVHVVEDVHGLRLQVETRFAGAALRALGAVGIFMPAGQLPLAITQHVIDGCIVPWHTAPALKLTDLLKVHTDFADSSLSTTTFVLAMNRAAYDRLPRDLKAVIDVNSGQPAAALAGAMWDLQAAAVADGVSQRGDPVTTLQPEAVAHWRKATEPVIEAWLKDMKDRKVDGGKLLAGARAMVAKYANEPEPQSPQQTQPPESAQAPPQPAPAKTDLTAAPKPQAPPNPPAAPPPTAPVAPATPAVKPPPAVTPPASAAASPPAAAPTPPPTPPAPPAVSPPATVSAAPAATPAPPPPPPAVKPVPVRVPPKTLDIPL
jgi:TRAP-type C4-dicarboxylate transport system substrate-binding protein